MSGNDVTVPPGRVRHCPNRWVISVGGSGRGFPGREVQSGLSGFNKLASIFRPANYLLAVQGPAALPEL